MSRRDLLRLAGASVPAIVFPDLARAQGVQSVPLIIVISDLGAATDPALARAILSEFDTRGIPVTVVLDRTALTSGGAAAQGAFLREIADRESGLLDLAVPVGAMAGIRRYFQMREAGALRASLGNGLGAAASRRVMTLFDLSDAGGVDLPAFRSAGFRILIRPQDGTDPTAEFVGRGQLSLQGGPLLALAGDHATVLARLDQTLGARRGGLLTLSLAGLEADRAGPMRDLAATMAERIGAAAGAGALHVTRPTDYLLQFGPPRMTEVALVLPAPPPGADAAALQAFAAMLAETGISFTLVSDVRPPWLPAEAGLVAPWPPGPGARPLPVGPHPLAVVLQAPVPPDDLPPVSVVVRAGATDRGATGLGPDGRLHIAAEDWATLSARGWPVCDSIALLIGPGDLATPVQRTAILRQLLAASAQNRTRFLTLRDLADQLLAPDAPHVRLWSTALRQRTDPPTATPLSPEDRDRLRADAGAAWSFIDRFTSPDTGLCAGTVEQGPVLRINREATYWDLASQMQGIVAAARLGLIPATEARARLSLMAGNLPLVEIDGNALPAAMFLTAGSLEITRPGFDICDAGRFLIALRLAVESGLLPAETATGIGASWNLRAAVIDGRPHSHDGTGWRDTTMSHCTPYVAPAFADLGLPLRSPYPRLSGAATADLRMSLLYAVAAMGSFGTEPLLLQAIEGAPTPEADYLSDVLFDAQLGWFEETGRFKCVSEIPLNRAPWFTYQGLRIDRLGAEAWTIVSPDRSAAFQTEAFRQSIELLSAKSAYLWAAVHPHPYSRALLQLIRDKARIDGFGFAVGVLAETLLPVENYSDVNTNGIILSAIDFLLRKTAQTD